MKYNIITIGGAMRDITFQTNEGILIDNRHDILRQELLAFENGAKIVVDEFHNLFGGGAANTAVNFAHSGFKTACLTCLGGDLSGKMILANLKQLQVSDKLVQLDKKSNSGLSCILVTDHGERIVFTSRQANDNLKIGTNDIKTMAQADWLYLASLSGDWLKTVKKVFSVKGPKIAWNPGVSQYQAGLKALSPFLKRCSVFCVNKDEAIELVLSDPRHKKKSHEFLDDINNLLEILKAAGPEIVIITNGALGAHAYDGNKFYYQKVFKEKNRVDMTGVGDAFNSSVVIGLALSDNNIKQALYLGAKNTAAKIAHFGAQNGLLDLRKLI